MKVINECSYGVIAFGWHDEHGYGEDVTIAPGESAFISGPYIGEMGGGKCHIALEGDDLICQESPDDGRGFQVIMGAQLDLGSGKKGINVRHYLEARQV